MKFNKVTAVYFSATGNTCKSVCAIADGIFEVLNKNDNKPEIINLTKKNESQDKIQFGEEDFVVIGAPVYGGRIYKGAIERFKCLSGNNTPVVIAVTYGNRHYDDALLELADLLKEQGFICIAAAALVGEHTFGSIQVGRPDSNDILQDKKFAKDVIEMCNKIDISEWNKLEGDKLEIPGNKPYRDGGNGGKFRPVTLDNCTGCARCVENCPEDAISSDCKTIDNDKCISCFACIKNCPENAKVMNTKSYIEFAADFSKKLSSRRENEYFIALRRK